jgi:hypothetical protein
MMPPCADSIMRKTKKLQPLWAEACKTFVGNSAYQSPQCEAVIWKNFIFHVSPCFTHTVLKCW